MNKKLIPSILNNLAVAMAVAAVVLNILGTLTPATGFTLLGVGVAALAITGLQNDEGLFGVYPAHGHRISHCPCLAAVD